MKLDKKDKLRIKVAYIRMQLILLDMWMNVIVKYYGLIDIWRTVIKHVFDDEVNIVNYEVKDVYVYLKRNLYCNYSRNNDYTNKNLYISHLYSILCDLNIHKVIKYFPIIYRVKNVGNTSKQEYMQERSRYKLSHSVANDGYDIKTQYYKEYKTIAKKYSWPFILNSDDTEE